MPRTLYEGMKQTHFQLIRFGPSEARMGLDDDLIRGAVYELHAEIVSSV